MDPATFTSLQPRLTLAREAAVGAPSAVQAELIELTEIARPDPAPPRVVPSDASRPTHGPTRSPASPAEAATLEAEIDRAAGPDHVARLAAYLARAYAPAAALFLVHRGMIAGSCSEGLAGRAEGLLVPASAPSLFADVIVSGQPFRGAPPEGGLDGRIFRALGRQHVEEAVLLPIAIGDRIVNLLYADNGLEEIGDASVAALGAVCQRVSRAYERLILARKRAARD